MSSEKKTCLTEWIIDEKGVPQTISIQYKLRYKDFIQQLKPGDRFTMLLEEEIWNNTKPQLAKIHAMIKEISQETGDNFKDTKKDIKERCGLTYYENKVKKYKSFAKCSKLELSNVIEIIYQLGTFLNINFEKNL